MIVPMKKATLFVLGRDEQTALEELKKLGVFDVDIGRKDSEPLENLRREKDTLQRALASLPLLKKPIPAKEVWDYEEALSIAGTISQTKAALEECFDSEQDISRDLKRLAPWGEFDPVTIGSLREKGIWIGLYELSKRELAAIPGNVRVFFVSKAKGLTRLIVVSPGEEVSLGVKPVRLPEESPAGLRNQLANVGVEREQIKEKLMRLTAYRQGLNRALQKNREAAEFEEVRLSLSAHEQVGTLGGFVPVTALDALKKAAREHGWGLALRDPLPDENVPTLIKNPKLVRIIKPVFEFLGTVPGYRESDISLWFLVFFSIFFAMLIGDAGYGVIFLVLTVTGRLLIKKMPAALFGLLLVTSTATIVWGALTGTWFSAQFFATAPFLKDLVIGPIATYAAADNTRLLMFICFVVGLAHLSLAHILSIIRNIKTFKGLSEIGRLAVIWGMFLMVLNLVLQEPFQPVALYLIGGGLVLIILFEQQKGNFFKGVLMGFANLFLTVLSIISSFADIISYVRLFAVSLAGVKIAQTFNGMASGMIAGMPGVGIVLGALVLFIGHALNMVLSLMSVLVHGIRLNMLEFSSHIGMEWSGREFRPFAYSQSSESGKEN